MSGRAIQLMVVTAVGVFGGVYTFGPVLEKTAEEREFKKNHDMGPGIVEVTPSYEVKPLEANIAGVTSTTEKK